MGVRTCNRRSLVLKLNRGSTKPSDPINAVITEFRLFVNLLSYTIKHDYFKGTEKDDGVGLKSDRSDRRDGVTKVTMAVVE